MKKIVLIFILLIGMVYAEEDYNNYDYLVVNFNLDTSFSFQPIGEIQKIDLVNANLSFFPKEDQNYDIQILEYFTKPPAEVYESDEITSFSWVEPKEKIFDFGINSVIKSQNSIAVIDKKIEFPIKKINSVYTEPGELIDINDAIRLQANELVRGEDDLYIAVFEVATWVENNIEYDLSTLTAEVVQKSSWVLENKYCVCDELTNLFISMVRSLGIPAKFVSGMAYTNILGDWGPHAWAEVYFPDKGWVPFDVTYGQFGWIDLSHIKLKEYIDSGDPSVRYFWKANGLEFESIGVDLDVELLEKGEKITSLLDFEIESLADNFGPGSYIPLQVKIKNNYNYYVPDTFFVSKSLELDGKNFQPIILEPYSENSLFWLMKVPEDLEEGYLYYTPIEVQDLFHESRLINVSYSNSFDIFSKEEALNLIESYENKPEKSYSNELALSCKSSKSFYLIYEKPLIICDIENIGNMFLEAIEICLERDCKKINVGISEIKRIDFGVEDLKKGSYQYNLIGRYKDQEMKNSVYFQILDNPGLDISLLDNLMSIGYKEEFDMSFSLTSFLPVKNIELEIDGKNVANLEWLNETSKITVRTKGKNFLDGNIKIKVIYLDEYNQKYILEKKYFLEITNIPWYIELLMKIGVF